jgi:hypothetical protein
MSTIVCCSAASAGSLASTSDRALAAGPVALGEADPLVRRQRLVGRHPAERLERQIREPAVLSLRHAGIIARGRPFSAAA